MPELWVVVPAFQEATIVQETVAKLAPFLPRVVVVDDGSSDRTAQTAERAGAVVVRHAINLGQGAALRTGIEFALRQGATHICTFDADGQHDPATISVMMDALRACDADVALASRFLGTTVAMRRIRGMVLRAAVLVTRLHTRLPVTDTHNGLRLFTRSAAQQIKIRQLRMAHGSEILSEIAANKLQFIEVPTTITYTEYSRRKGQSLFNSVNIVTDLLYHSWKS